MRTRTRPRGCAARVRRPLWGAAAQAALATVAALRGDEEDAERHAAEAERVALPAGAPPTCSRSCSRRAARWRWPPAARPRRSRTCAGPSIPTDPAHDPRRAGCSATSPRRPRNPSARAFVRALVAARNRRGRTRRSAHAHATLVLADDADADAAFAAGRARIGEQLAAHARADPARPRHAAAARPADGRLARPLRAAAAAFARARLLALGRARAARARGHGRDRHRATGSSGSRRGSWRSRAWPRAG